MSLPARGAWVEIDVEIKLRPKTGESLPARGAWVEIHTEKVKLPDGTSRSPRGERGLKLVWDFGLECDLPVAPREGSVG